MAIRCELREYHQRNHFNHRDYWPELAKNVDEVRKELGVVPAEAA